MTIIQLILKKLKALKLKRFQIERAETQNDLFDLI